MSQAPPLQAPSSQPVLARLHATDEKAFHELIYIYEQSFPKSERKPVTTLHRMLASERYYFLLAKENEITVGFAIGRLLSGNSAALLEYMAVIPDHQGRGLGGRILLAAALALNSPPVTLLIETESDRAESPDQALRTRRKRFYRALGAREISNLRWVMPSVTATPPPAMEMLLFPGTAHALTRDNLRQWLTSIYVEVYEQSADDPRIDTMLADLPNKVELI